MPRQNRVTPLSELIATPERGLVYGNRGCLHDEHGRIRRRYAVRRWIACRLEFRGWHRSPLMQPGRFTELFFLDEATAFAAGHRPCALCRREDYDRFGELWPGEPRTPTRSTCKLHGERLADGAQRHHTAPFGELPDGAFVLHDGEPWLVLGGRAAALDAGRLRASARHAPAGPATVITPPSLVTVLRARLAAATCRCCTLRCGDTERVNEPSVGLLRAIAVAAVVAGVAVAVVVLASDHQEAKAAFAIFGPAVGWGFIGTGLWAWRREPGNRTGRLLVALGFAWLLSTLEASNAPLPYTIGAHARRALGIVLPAPRDDVSRAARSTPGSTGRS